MAADEELKEIFRKIKQDVVDGLPAELDEHEIKVLTEFLATFQPPEFNVEFVDEETALKMIKDAEERELFLGDLAQLKPRNSPKTYN